MRRRSWYGREAWEGVHTAVGTYRGLIIRVLAALTIPLLGSLYHEADSTMSKKKNYGFFAPSPLTTLTSNAGLLSIKATTVRVTM